MIQHRYMAKDQKQIYVWIRPFIYKTKNIC